VVEVRVGEQDGGEVTGSRLDGRNHVERRGARVHDHTLAGDFTPRDVPVLGEVTACETLYFHSRFFHFPQDLLPSKEKARGNFTHELSVAGFM
jgi:hypothetical protein